MSKKVLGHLMVDVETLGIRSSLKLGENIFEFTADKMGTIRFTCSMGMYTGSFNVIN